LTWRYNDNNGNVATQTQRIIVGDATPPVITSLSVNPGNLWPPNHKLVAVRVTGTAVDNVTPSNNIVMRIISITSTEPLNAKGDGNSDYDYEITGLMTVNLRAERSGTGDGRIYTITIRATDAAGNSSLSSVNLGVVHDQDSKNKSK
jgi:hypothetical protein